MYELKSTFIDRDRELDILLASLENARKGLGKIVFLSGELGIGKTSLMNEFIKSRTEGFIVLRGRCIEGGSPYHPFIEAIVQYEEMHKKMEQEEQLPLALIPIVDQKLIGQYPSFLFLGYNDQNRI